MKVKLLLMFQVIIFMGLIDSKCQAWVPDYYAQGDFLQASPGSLGYGLNGYYNPCLLNYLNQPEFLFTWSPDKDHFDEIQRWGLFTAIPELGFGLIHEKSESGEVTDYRVSMGLGNKTRSLGVGYGWSGGDKELFQRTDNWLFSGLYRPSTRLSLGISGIFSSSDQRLGIADIGVRPLGNEKITVFYDYALREFEKWNKGSYSFGMVVEPVAGVRVAARYFDTDAFSVGINVSFGHSGIMSQAYYDKDKNYSYNTYGIRLGAMDRSALRDIIMKDRNYLEIDLKGDMRYQRYAFFDKANTLSNILDLLENVKKDVSIGGVAINLSGSSINHEMIWEIREKIKEVKAAGKHVIIYVDRVEMNQYHLASVADRIILDPDGFVTLQGYLFGQTFFNGALEKIGIGVDEFREFKYKAAFEVLSRKDMSEAEREQLKGIIDDFYALFKKDVCEGRNFSSEKFESLIHKDVFFLAKEAQEKGLVDELGRWESIKKSIEKFEGDKKRLVTDNYVLMNRQTVDDRWGEVPQIAVIYALGVCDMEKGINARRLEKVIDSVKDNPQIKGVVFRVDSPGGDALASDIVAEALKRCREKKPVVVSQGMVAGSGGYWISMYGNTIVAAPNTITGSIGVAGGWFYNQGLKEKLGFTTDYVKAGEHADMDFGFTMPFLGVTIPDRKLTDEERTKVTDSMKTMYKEFVEKVSYGRKRSFDQIEEVAQGRIWSGLQGKEKGLVDKLGGVETALYAAKELAGIKAEQDVDVLELPRKGLFNKSMLMPKLFGIEQVKKQDPRFELLKFRINNNGEPVPIMPMEDMDWIWEYNALYE